MKFYIFRQKKYSTGADLLCRSVVLQTSIAVLSVDNCSCRISKKGVSY